MDKQDHKIQVRMFDEETHTAVTTNFDTTKELFDFAKEQVVAERDKAEHVRSRRTTEA